jgi:betaine-homocysteine S-methyltransferase
MTKKGLLERLAEGPIIGDGGFVFALEKRGYVKAGPWTPEAAVEHPDAGLFYLTNALGLI